MKAKLSDSLCRGLKAQTDTIEVYDTMVPGLVLRVTSRGVKSWSVRYRVRGNKKLDRYTIGEYPFKGLSEAREVAIGVKNAARSGVDPAAERRERRQAASEKAALTVRVVADRYVKVKKDMPSLRHYRSAFDLHILPAIGDIPLADLRREHVASITTGILAAGHGQAANKVLAVSKALLSWAVDQGLLEASPAAGIKTPHTYRPKERALSDGEVAKLWGSINGAPIRPEFPIIMKLILVTGQRPGEVAGMTREEVSLGDALWIIPAARMKARREHVVPLSKLAVSLLRPVLEQEGRSSLLFQGPMMDGQHEANVIAGAASKAQEHVGIPKWTPHDLRRSCLTGLGRLGVDELIISRVASHAISSVTARVYNRHAYLAEKRAALDRWAAHLEGLLQGGSEIVSLATRRQA